MNLDWEKIFGVSIGVLVVAVVVTSIMGQRGCETQPAGPVEFTADDLNLALDFAIIGMGLGKHQALEDEDFDACVAVAAVDAGLHAAKIYGPEIELEIRKPDGVMSFPGYELNAVHCLQFAPEPWPPLIPDPMAGVYAMPIVENSLLLGATALERHAPGSGEGCYRAAVGVAVLRSLAVQMPSVLQEILVDADLKILVAGFDLDYSGCSGPDNG